MTLLEKLTVMAIISILASVLLTALGRAYTSAKLWIWGAYGLNQRRINDALGDNDALLEGSLTSQTTKWYVKP